MSTLSAEICGDGHKLRFFCSNCNRFFCGECSTITHSRKGGLKDHDVEPIEERLTIEAQNGEHLIKVFTELSDNAEATAIAKNAINEKSRETLTEFLTHVEQLLMTSQITRDVQFLHGVRRDYISLLQRETSAMRQFDSKMDPFGALVSRLTMNKHLDEQIERVRKSLENAGGALEVNVVEAIYKAAVALKERNTQESIIKCIFNLNADLLTGTLKYEYILYIYQYFSKNESASSSSR